MKENSEQTLLFDSLYGKKVECRFDGGSVTSDAGTLLLRSIERDSGIVSGIARVLRDHRHASYVTHGIDRMLRQRIMQIALGYEDANDCDSLRSDPAIKTACGVLPFSGIDLASQPTMTRFENSVSRSDLYRIAKVFLEMFVRSFGKKPPRRIILDLDDTDDTVHGGQQQSLLNAYNDEYCFQPMHIYEASTGRLVTTILRPGKRSSGKEIVSILKRVVGHLKICWPKTRIIIRGDSHYSAPEVHEFCEAFDLWFIFGQRVTSIIQAMAPSVEAATRCAVEGKEVRLYSESYYQPKSWSVARRIILRTIASAKGVDVRAIVTNMPWSDPRRLYDRAYCARGRMENMIKDHKVGLQSDRTSCHRFVANQFRLFLHSAAYALMHSLRERALGATELLSAQFDTIRLRLLKIGARVVEKSKKVIFHLPSSYPGQAMFEQIHGKLHSVG